MMAMLKAVITSLNVEKKKKRHDPSETATAEWYNELKPNLLKSGAVTLAPLIEMGTSSGLTFPLSALCSRPYAEGRICRIRAMGTRRSHICRRTARISLAARGQKTTKTSRASQDARRASVLSSEWVQSGIQD